MTGRVSQPRPRRSSLLNLMQVIFARCNVDSASGIPRSNVNMMNNKTAGDKDTNGRPSHPSILSLLLWRPVSVGKTGGETARQNGFFPGPLPYVQNCARQSHALD